MLSKYLSCKHFLLYSFTSKCDNNVLIATLIMRAESHYENLTRVTWIFSLSLSLLTQTAWNLINLNKCQFPVQNDFLSHTFEIEKFKIHNMQFQTRICITRIAQYIHDPQTSVESYFVRRWKYKCAWILNFLLPV